MHFWWKRSRPVSSPRRRTNRTRPLRLRLEKLETRTLLSVADLWTESVPLFSGTVLPGFGYTPAQVRQAYGFDRITFDNGRVRGDGAGQTIAIVTAYDHPFIESDLRAFNRAFKLPNVPRFTKVDQFGGADYPRFDAGWALETALDVQWAHAIAPGANILLVEANSARLGDLLTAVDYARQQPGVVAVSMSWGADEFAQQSRLNRFFTTPAGHVDGSGLPGGVTFVAASGDSGRPMWPAVSPNVLAVGGSRLRIQGNGAYVGEVGWRGSGGGVSQYEPQPDYQSGLTASQGRSIPDVSYGADPTTGYAVYATLPGYGPGWFHVGGTSAGAPQWAGLVAIAAQGRNLAGLPALANTADALYNLSAAAFHDIVLGTNGREASGLGYDRVTGLGSPRANLVVSGLVSTEDGGAAAGPAAPVEGVSAEESVDVPPVDAGTLALIMQLLSETPLNKGEVASLAPAPVRPPEALPPVQPPIPLPPPPVSIIHNVGGGEFVPVDELQEKSVPPSAAKPAAPQEARAGEERATGTVIPNEHADAAQVQAAQAVGVNGVAPEQAPPGDGGWFRWVAAAGLALLFGGLWTGWTLERRQQRCECVQVGR